MKRLLRLLPLGLVLLLLVGSCRSAERVMYRPTSLALPDRLPSLELAVDDELLTQHSGAFPDDVRQLFEHEVRMNLSEPEDTARYGYAHLRILHCEAHRCGRLWQGVQLTTLMAPALLGAPVESYETRLRATLHIVNAYGDTLASYTADGRARVPVALYYGYSQTQAHRVADLAAVRRALHLIKPRLATDSRRVCRELLEAGPLAARGAVQHAQLSDEETPTHERTTGVAPH